MSTRIVLAEEQPLILAGLEHTLADLPELEIVGSTTRRSEVVRLVAERVPDVLLLDLGLAAGVRPLIEQLHAQAPSLRVVALADAADRSRGEQALRSGACGFVPMSTPAAELASVLLRAMNGTQLDELLLDLIGVPRVILTGRESEILGRAAAGETTKQIARALRVSETTVKYHLSNLHRKLGTASRDELVRAALQGSYASGVVRTASA